MSEFTARQQLLNNRVGYGASAYGGRDGTLVEVTNLNDSGAGSLRSFLESTNPYWIKFSVSGTITLSTSIFVRSNKTIDGRGADITIDSKGLYCGIWVGNGQACDNVIVENIKFASTINDTHVLTCCRQATNIWVDHVTWEVMAADVEPFYTGSGASGHTDSPDSITLSWCRWNDTDVGHGAWLCSDASTPQDNDACRVTAHHNWWKNCAVRHPLQEAGTIHSYNNLQDRGEIAAQITGGASFLSENDIYVPPYPASYPRVKNEVIEAGNAFTIKVVDPWLQGDATYEEFNTAGIFTPPYSYSLATADSTLQTQIQNGAGWLNTGPIVDTAPPPPSGLSLRWV